MDWRDDQPTYEAAQDAWGEEQEREKRARSPHTHEPMILHRTGGSNVRDVRLFNACGVCGEQIERHTVTEPWALASDVDKHIDQMISEGSV